VQSEKIANDANPVWEGQTLTLEMPAPFCDGAELRVRLWDDDVISHGSQTVPSPPTLTLFSALSVAAH
jgi:hypothetical protein